ncbi:MAG: F0F1 ATP synthase subunit delta [Candidatus Omnitrophota bacterium]
MLIQLLVIQLTTFIILILVLRVLFYRHLNSALKRLRELQEEALAKEANIKDELDRLKLVKLAEVEKGKLEAKRIMENAKKQAEVLRVKLEEDAKQESQKIITLGKEMVEKSQKSLAANIEMRALNLAQEMIKYTFSEKGIEFLQHLLMDELITEIENLDKEKVSVKSGRAKVVSSAALSEEEKARLKKTLSSNLGYELVIEETIDPALVTGLVIQIGEFVIDGSLSNKLKKAIPYIKLVDAVRK